jgi:hypothetical protein
MTVVVAFVGPDGAVMASDSEASEEDHTRYDVEKIWLCGGLLIGYPGNSAVRQRLEPAIDQLVRDHFPDAEVPRNEARDGLQAAVAPELRKAYQAHVGGQVLPSGIPATLAGKLLVLGRDDAGYWLLEIQETNTATFTKRTGSTGSEAARRRRTPPTR